MNKKTLLLLVTLSSALIFPTVFAQTGSGVEVSGILDTNTTWTKENSPYEITETVQVAQGVVLTIQPGVTVSFSGTGNMFLVGGAIEAEGTIDEKIVFHGNGADNFFDVLDYQSSVTLDYCVFDDGTKLWSMADGVDQVILRHSTITNVAETSLLYHWQKACFIEYNLFVDTAGFGFYNWLGSDSNAALNFRYNVVKSNIGVFLACSPNVHDQEYVIQYNSFVDVDGTFFELHSGLGDTIEIAATQNFWGTTDTTIIDSLIQDKSDDISLPEEIEYSPILTGPHPDGAILPLTVSFDVTPDDLFVDVDLEFDASASVGEYSTMANYTWNFDDGTETTLDEPVTTHSFANSGEYEITLTITDEYGFQNSTSITVDVLDDTTAPVTTDNYDGDWQSSDFTITLTAVDDETGIAETYYKINNGTTKTVSADGQPLIDQEGTDNQLEFWSEDNAGNLEEVNVLSDIMLDKTKPTIGDLTATPDSEIQENQDVTIEVEVSDSLSGLDAVTLSYSTDNSSSWHEVSMTLNSTTDLWQGEIPGQSIWTNVNYRISALDVAGNQQTSNEADLYSYDVIPEFPAELIVLVFVALTMVAILARKKVA